MGRDSQPPTPRKTRHRFHARPANSLWMAVGDAIDRPMRRVRVVRLNGRAGKVLLEWEPIEFDESPAAAS